MKNIYNLSTSIFLVSALSANANQQDILFEDNFESNQFHNVLSEKIVISNELENWNVTKGDVDVIGIFSWGHWYPQQGRYVDLIGFNAGEIELKEPVVIKKSGKHVLAFKFGNNLDARNLSVRNDFVVRVVSDLDGKVLAEKVFQTANNSMPVTEWLKGDEMLDGELTFSALMGDAVKVQIAQHQQVPLSHYTAVLSGAVIDDVKLYKPAPVNGNCLTPINETAVFNDDFESNMPGIAVTHLTNWTVLSGNIDVKGKGLWDSWYPNQGALVDLIGTEPSVIKSKSSIILDSNKEYELSFKYGNNHDARNLEVQNTFNISLLDAVTGDLLTTKEFSVLKGSMETAKILYKSDVTRSVQIQFTQLKQKSLLPYSAVWSGSMIDNVKLQAVRLCNEEETFQVEYRDQY